MEFFVNYDCDVESKNIIEQIIEILSKIAQGIYTKAEFSNIIQPEQEKLLKGKALLSLVCTMRSLVNFYVEYEKKQQELEEESSNLDISMILN